MTKATILVVDDDPKIRALLQELLQRHDMVVVTASSVSEAVAQLEKTSFDLMTLDVMMPGENGTSFCSRIRQQSALPIIIVSALGDDVDRIIGLEVGADDYLPKPFNPRELIARINSILRRSRDTAPQSEADVDADVDADKIYHFAGFELDVTGRSLKGPDGPVSLTSGEFALLLHLVERAPRVLSRDQLLDYTRGATANPFDRSIDTQISRLRGKLEPNTKSPGIIKTVRNLGYALASKVTLAGVS